MKGSWACGLVGPVGGGWRRGELAAARGQAGQQRGGQSGHLDGKEGFRSKRKENIFPHLRPKGFLDGIKGI